MLGFILKFDTAGRKKTSVQASSRVSVGLETSTSAQVSASGRVQCPVCDEVMRVCAEGDLDEFAGLDVKLHRLSCDACGMVTGRAFHPSVGYDAHLVR